MILFIAISPYILIGSILGIFVLVMLLSAMFGFNPIIEIIDFIDDLIDIFDVD